MISVIIPLYNKESIIERSLQSVLSQDYDDFEIVVVNDGSTDRSAEIVKSLTDPRVHLIEQENGGPSKARNTGVKHAKGDWIVFLDADDELLPGALKRFRCAIEDISGFSFFACPFYNRIGDGLVLKYHYTEGHLSNLYKSAFFGRFLPRAGAFICKKQILLNCPFNEQIRRFEDLELLYRLYKKVNVYLLSEPSVRVNVDFASASSGRKDISEDFVGHLDFKGKSFWERMCLYQLFLWERDNYPEQCKKLYPFLYKRLDYYILYQLLTRTRLLWV